MRLIISIALGIYWLGLSLIILENNKENAKIVSTIYLVISSMWFVCAILISEIKSNPKK